MFASLFPDLLSISATISDTIAMAAQHGFGGFDVNGMSLLGDRFDAEEINAAKDRAGLRTGYVGLPPGRLPVDDADWERALAALPTIAERARRIGFTRAGLVILPFHERLPFAEAFDEHVARLNVVAGILDDHGISLGLEYVSPVTRRAPFEHHFVYDMAGMLRLCEAIDSPATGLMLDCFHWHCAGESRADIERLRPEQVVLVHLNDAPNVSVEAQTVLARAFPGDTGVIDLASFIGGLQTIGYDGPATCEPMNQAIEDLPDTSVDAVLAKTSTSMRSAIA